MPGFASRSGLVDKWSYPSGCVILLTDIPLCTPVSMCFNSLSKVLYADVPMALFYVLSGKWPLPLQACGFDCCFLEAIKKQRRRIATVSWGYRLGPLSWLELLSWRLIWRDIDLPVGSFYALYLHCLPYEFRVYITLSYTHFPFRIHVYSSTPILHLAILHPPCCFQ